MKSQKGFENHVMEQQHFPIPVYRMRKSMAPMKPVKICHRDSTENYCVIIQAELTYSLQAILRKFYNIQFQGFMIYDRPPFLGVTCVITEIWIHNFKKFFSPLVCWLMANFQVSVLKINRISIIIEVLSQRVQIRWKLTIPKIE